MGFLRTVRKWIEATNPANDGARRTQMEKIDKPFGRALEKVLEQGTKAYAAETERMKKEWERQDREKKDKK
jgi:hypothetical protein